MNCREHLCEEDKNGENLFGTGASKGHEAEYMDTYVDTRHTAQTQAYIMYGEEIFEFISSRYGGDVIKRYYIRKNGSYYTSVEVHLQQLRTWFLNADQLMNGKFE